MSTTALSSYLPNLYDLKKSMGASGEELEILELLKQACPMLEDMGWQEGNTNTGHIIRSRTALPAPSWVAIGEGVTPTKGKTDQVTETCSMMADYSVIPAKLAQMNGGAAYRVSEDAAFLQGFAHELQHAVIYHATETDFRNLQGLAVRYDSTSSGTCAAAAQVVAADSGASGSDQTSIWGIVWGPKACYGIYPKGSSAGLKGEDHGLVDWDDPNSTVGTPKKFPAYVKYWEQSAGLVVEDYQQAVRVCNIDTSALVADYSSGSDLVQSMVKAYHKIRNPEAGRLVWYCNRTVQTYLHLQALERASSTLRVENVEGKPVTMFLGSPIRRCDAITDAEDVVS